MGSHVVDCPCPSHRRSGLDGPRRPLATVQGTYGQRLSDIQASSIFGALPLVILFLLFQHRLVEGVAGSGVKG